LKIKIERKELLPTLRNIQNIAKKSGVLAIVENVLIKAENGQIELTATDLTSTVKNTISADVEIEGTICVNAQKLFRIIDLMQHETIGIEQNGGMIKVDCTDIIHHLSSAAPDDFPHIEINEKSDTWELQADIFRIAIEKACTIPAPAEDKRAHIIGLLFKIENGKMEVASTDGSRLNLSSHDCAGPDFHQIILEKAGMKELVKSLSDNEITVSMANNHFTIEQDKKTLMTRTLEGNYPKYWSIIDRSTYGDSKRIILEKDNTVNLLKQMAVLTNEDYKGVSLEFSGGALVTHAINPEAGESSGEIRVDYSGPKIKAALNVNYLIGAINSVDGKEIEIRITDEMHPVMFSMVDSDDFKALVMPLKKD
jgi:DNA polymerase-3 subunit beta